MKTLRLYGVLLVSAVAAAFLCQSCRPSKDEKPKGESDLVLRELAALHGSVANADTIFAPEAQMFPFTFQVQQALSDRESSPVVVCGMLEDIFMRNGELVPEVEAFLGLSEVTFRLALDSNKASGVITSGIGRFDEIAVVARIRSIERIAFEIKPSREEVLSYCGRYIVSGECIDFRRLPKQPTR